MPINIVADYGFEDTLEPEEEMGYEFDEEEMMKDKRRCTKLFHLEEKKTAVATLSIFLVFAAGATYSVTLPSQYLFLQSMGVCDATVVWNGVALALYYVGQFFSSNFIGSIANRTSMSHCLYIVLILDILGNILYGFSQNVWMLLVARLLAGAGSGTISLARSYMACVYSSRKRTAALSKLSLAQAAGYVYGPALGAGVSLVNVQVTKWIVFNQFTLPAFLSALLGLFGLCVILISFRDLPRLKRANNSGSSWLLDEGEQLGAPSSEMKTLFEPGGLISTWRAVKYKVEVLILLFLFLVVTLVFSLFETTLAPTTEYYFHWSSASVQNAGDVPCAAESFEGSSSPNDDDDERSGVLWNGLLYVVCGVAAFLVLLLLSQVNRIKVKFIKSNDRFMLLVGWATMMLACLVLFTWGGNMTLYQYVPGMIMLVVGFCISQVVCLSIYSQMLGNIRPGLLMGWITGAGAFGRMIGPVVAGVLFAIGKLDFPICITFLTLCVSFVFIVICWKKLLSPSLRNMSDVLSLTDTDN